jgi:hypothetical protein
MIGGRRYLEGDTVYISNNIRAGLGMEVKPDIRAHALDWYTDDPVIIRESTRAPGYGGIRWGLLGLILADAVDDLINTFTRLGEAIGGIARSLLDEDMIEKYDGVMAKLNYAYRPLFGPAEWNLKVFPEGRVDLKFTADLLLGITIVSYILSKIPGLAEGLASLVGTLRARAAVDARHNALLTELDEIDELIRSIPKPAIESQFKMLDDQITPQALRSLSEALLRDKRSPINELFDTYPEWGVFPE